MEHGGWLIMPLYYKYWEKLTNCKDQIKVSFSKLVYVSELYILNGIVSQTTPWAKPAVGWYQNGYLSC